MYGLIYKMKGLLLGNPEQATGANNDRQDLIKELLFDEDEDEVLVETIDLAGKITELRQGHGLIDGKYYFEMAGMSNLRERLWIGKNVMFTATRENENQEWVVKDIRDRVEENWEIPDEEVQRQKDEFENMAVFSKKAIVQKDAPEWSWEDWKLGIDQRALVGRISAVKYKEVTIGSDSVESFTFNLDDVKLPFIPLVGDWLYLQTKPDTHGSGFKVVYCDALRTKEVTGRVTSVDQNRSRGCVEDEIYFDDFAITVDYVPKEFDMVRVVAIESTYGRYGWRAIALCPSSRTKAKAKKSTGGYPSSMIPTSVQRSLASQKAKETIPKNIATHGVRISDILQLEQCELGSVCYGKQRIVNEGGEDCTLVKGEQKNDSGIMQFFLIEPGNLNWQVGKSGNGPADQDDSLDFERLKIGPGRTLTLMFLCEGKLLGETSELCTLHFDGFQMQFKLTMTVFEPEPDKAQTAAFGTTEEHTSVYRRSFMSGKGNNIFTNNIGVTTVGGVRPMSNNVAKFIPRQLPQYPVRDCVWEAVREDSMDRVLRLLTSVTERLSPLNYGDKWGSLLHLEEIALTVRMDGYNLERVVFQPKGDHLALVVPGLAEKRPSLLVGDRIIVSSPWDGQDVSYEGFIHQVHRNEVFVKFHQDFHSKYDHEFYNVQFFFNRTPLRRCHQAALLAPKQLGMDVLFPNAIEMNKPQFVFIDSEETKSSASKNTTPAVPELPNCNGSDVSTSESTSDSAYSPSAEKAVRKARRSTTVAERLFLRKSESEGAEKEAPNCSVTNKEVSISESESDISSSSSKLRNGHLESPPGANPLAVAVTPCSADKAASIKPHFKSHQPTGIKTLNWVNTKLNLEQRNAVRNILKGEARPLPYVIFGPPGTGKTVTMVEAILQVYMMRPDSRILVTTPSNSSADLIVERLHLSNCLIPGDMVRLNAFSRSAEAIPHVILPYCQTSDNLEYVVRHRVLVSTCVSSGAIYQLGIRNGHFTHVFVDESGQATEPECLIPLGLLTTARGGQLVLAGDPKQLGPVLQSYLAKDYGLDTSLLERLTSLQLYSRNPELYQDSGNYNPFVLTKLLRNYRSHPSLLKLPSLLFYEDELIPGAELASVSRLCYFPELPTPGLPLIFHGVEGENVQENDCPSWLNPVEAYQVSTYLRSLYGVGLTPAEVGILTPYRKQVEKIKYLLEVVGLEAPKVGTVEEFQGQEREAIIVSTVRSASEALSVDSTFSLGFLSNPKRFNVAITRSKCLLIVIGNPHVLCLDSYWNVFIRNCVDYGAYTGCDLPDSVRRS